MRAGYHHRHFSYNTAGVRELRDIYGRESWKVQTLPTRPIPGVTFQRTMDEPWYARATINVNNRELTVEMPWLVDAERGCRRLTVQSKVLLEDAEVDAALRPVIQRLETSRYQLETEMMEERLRRSPPNGSPT